MHKVLCGFGPAALFARRVECYTTFNEEERMRKKGKINWGSAILLVALIAVYFATGGGLQKPAVTGDARGDREAVAAYIRTHGELPDYYITKEEAAGWAGRAAICSPTRRAK